ncbi:Transcription factor S-II (TFIIS), putative [Angomonas deanei]|uniref:Transcription factor S-II (TFIIS), putative n=1 Tax=Angomonas deanei TaxID=59799 RepID=A0A7G2C2N1_9TRYP|nr:Transcription factor S-II (TFIIS), putative [Angomonas deanei]
MSLFALGTTACEVCGEGYLQSNTQPEELTQAQRYRSCTRCGYAARQDSGRTTVRVTEKGIQNVEHCTDAFEHFDKNEITNVLSYLATLPQYATVTEDGKGKTGSPHKKSKTETNNQNNNKLAGEVAVDNRVLEEAYCEKCGDMRSCRSYARQIRSADEGQTIFYQCTTCKSEWQHNS